MTADQEIKRKIRVLGFGLAVLGVAISGYLLGADRDQAVVAADTAKSYTLDLADRTLADCAAPTTGPDPATCEKAAEAKTVIQQTIVNPPRPQRSDAEVRTLIEQVIAEHPEWLPAGPPGEPAPPIDYERIIREVQARVPKPENGKDGAPAVVDYERIIREVLALMPEPEKGDPGDTGPAGAAGQKGDKGETGEQGPPGRSVIDGPFPVNTENGCVMRTLYDQEPFQVDRPANALHCL